MNNINNLSLAFKAGLVKTGEDQILSSIKTRKSKLVIVAKDASDNKKKLLNDKSSFYNIRCIELFSSNELSRALGKNNCVAVSITSEGFANKFKEVI